MVNGKSLDISICEVIQKKNEKRFVFQDFLTCSENDADTLFDCFVSTINVKVE